MPNPTLSTNDLAKVLNINVSTVKRWADSGQLQCIRTPGGHRRFRLDDVYSFLSAKGFDPHSLRPLMNASESLSQLDEAVRHRNWEWMCGHVTGLALEARVRDLVKLFVATHLAGITPAELADFVVLPAAEQASGRWTTSRYSVADQRLVEHVLAAAVAEMRSHWQAQRELSHTAIAGSFSPDGDGMLAQTVSQALAADGWRVFPYGADLPAAAFLDAAQRRKPDLVVVTATTVDDLDVFRRNCRGMAEATEESGAKMLCTGRAFSSIEVRCEYDITIARGLVDMIEYLREHYRGRGSEQRRRRNGGNNHADDGEDNAGAN